MAVCINDIHSEPAKHNKAHIEETQKINDQINYINVYVDLGLQLK